MKKILLLLVVHTVIFNQSLKASPGTYYNSIDTNKTCGDFKSRLFNLIKNDNHLSYGDIDNNYYRTDVKPNENGTGIVIVDKYCGENPTGLDYCTFRWDTGFCGGTSSNVVCVCYNKEHVVPTSWFDGTSSVNTIPRSDMHFVWPADTKINIEKSNYPLGYVNVADISGSNGTKIGSSNAALNYGYSNSKVFEPIDSFKGDFARAYLYFVTRYQDSLSAWKRNNIANDVFSSSSYSGLEPWILKLCIQWHKMDPPSAFEQKRNDSVFAIQGNRNPFIDYPNWAEKVFGENGNDAACVASGIRSNKSVEFSVYPNPANQWITLRLGAALKENAMIEVSDVTGRKLLSQPLNANDFTKTIDIAGLSKGLYLVNVRYQDISQATLFVKE